MADAVIRPSFKFVQAGLVLVVLIIFGAFYVHYLYMPHNQTMWLPAVSALLLLWPASAALRRMFTTLKITGDKLYYETGAISKQTRIIQIPKIQDVRVHQSLGQRMVNIGDLSIEMAGEASRLTVQNIDNPRALAERILEMAAHGDHGLGASPAGIRK